MSSLFIRDLPLFEQRFIFRGDLSGVGQEHIQAFDPSQYRRAAAAFASTQYDDSFHDDYRILSVTNVMAANNNCTIQNRTTIFDSK